MKKKTKKKSRVKHSIVHWNFAKYWDLDQTCRIAKKLGCKSVELIEPPDWPTLKKHKMDCAIVPSHLFMQGMNNPRYQGACVEMVKTRIDQCVDAGFKTVITFPGYLEETGPWCGGGIPDLKKLPKKRKVLDQDVALKTAIKGFKKVVGYAEKKKINLSMEILNTRVTDHPMKGHPGYQGDSIDICMEIINKVGSPRFGILFDVYHVQIMNGDLIRRVQQCGKAINHVHVAGVPGRGELDEEQEVNFPPVIKAIMKTGYKGYIGYEFIPTRPPLPSLKQAIKLCSV